MTKNQDVLYLKCKEKENTTWKTQSIQSTTSPNTPTITSGGLPTGWTGSSGSGALGTTGTGQTRLPWSWGRSSSTTAKPISSAARGRTQRADFSSQNRPRIFQKLSHTEKFFSELPKKPLTPSGRSAILSMKAEETPAGLYP